MKEAKKAAFEFISYQIPRFTFNEPTTSTKEANSLNVGFNPSGEYNEETCVFKLTVDFEALLKGETESKNVVFVNFTAVFKFDSETKFEDIPPYFYRNSIAIVFPFIRSFVSTLTLQANMRPIIMPIMNLSDLEQPLKEKTTKVGNQTN